MQKITPFLWFDGNAEEAINYYVSIFKNARILNLRKWPDGVGKDGEVLTGSFEIDGQQFHALNGGPQYKFTPAISLFVDCKDQAEVDELWEKLSEGGHKDRCGWLTDKFGLSWQIIPRTLTQLMGDPDPAKASRVMQAMMKMDKIEIKKLEEAAEEK
jgi:predicted 3-demethylubiquinone-9 3-methyltransferase (glyoxalase superfamily)